MMLLIFILSLMLIVSVHEFGHYLLASCFRVAIRTFSIGLGRPMVSVHSKSQGTDFQIAILPIGGYVKFAEEDMPGRVLYSRLTAWKKIIILMAGPLFNFIMALFILLGLLKAPHYQMYPMIILPDGAKVKITHVNKQVVGSWIDVKNILSQDKHINSMDITQLSNEKKRNYHLVSVQKLVNLEKWLQQQGFEIFDPALPAIIGEFSDNSGAKEAGLQLGDKILAINEEPVSDIRALVKCLEKYPDDQVSVRFWRQGKIFSTKVKLTSVYHGRKKIGALGVRTYEISAYPKWYHQVQFTWAQTFRQGFGGVAEILGLQTNEWKNIDKNYSSIAGPIGIAHAAHQAWSISFKSYCLFLVWLNLGIGLMNLLPLPIFDGGQCVLVLVEKWFPNLLTNGHKNFLALISIIALLFLMLLSLHNDWSFLH